MKFEEAVIALLEINHEVSKTTLLTLAKLAQIPEKQAKTILKEMLDKGTIYVSRRETIFKLV